MKHIRSMICLGGLWLLISLLTACLARLQTTDAPAESTQDDVHVLSPLTNDAVTLDVPTADPVYPLPTPLTTPMPATLMPEQIPVTMPPAPTIQVKKTVDLAHGTPVPLNEFIAQFVRRANGKYDTYLIPPWLFLGTSAEVEIRLNELMEIKSGDEALGWTNAEQAAQLDGKPTPTPIPTQPLHKVVDLAYGTPMTDAEMIVMHVRRTDGTYDEYWLPLSLLKGTSAEINARLDQLMEIQSGDERFWWRTVVDPVTLHTLPTLVSTPTP